MTQLTPGPEKKEEPLKLGEPRGEPTMAELVFPDKEEAHEFTARPAYTFFNTEPTEDTGSYQTCKKQVP